MRALLLGALVLATLTACSGSFYDPKTVNQLPKAPAGTRLTAQFFGVSTVLLSDGQSKVMSDGFFSRPALLKALAPLEPNETAISEALRLGNVAPVDALLVAHSHYDHAMDSSIVAEKTGATIVGSLSTCRIVLSEQFPPGRTRIVEGGELFTFGSFKVRVFRSEHTPPPPLLPPLDRDVDPDFHPPATIFKYQQGGTYSFLIEHDGRTILIHPSTNVVPGMYRNVRVDAVFLGVALLSRQGKDFAENYWREVVTTTGAKLVIPVHWDDLKRPLDKPLKYLGWPDDPPTSIDMIRALAGPDVTVAFMPLYEPVDVLAYARIDPNDRKSVPPATTVRQPPTCPSPP